MGDNNIIIGFGEFGASIARVLLTEKKHSKRVTAIDCQESTAASYDLYKIVRNDYGNIQRTRQAIDMHQQWKQHPFFAPHYYTTGRVVIYYPGALHRLDEIDRCRSKMHLPLRQRYGIEDVRLSFGKTHAQDGAMNFMLETMQRSENGDLTLIYNEDDGVVRWDDYMTCLRQYCKAHQCEIQHAEVQKLGFDGGNISSVHLSNGKVINARNMQVFLAAGPWITRILAESHLSLPDPDRVTVATGVFSFHIELNGEQRLLLKDTPPFSVYGANMSGADGGEFLPPMKDDGIAKIGWTMPFKYVRKNETYSWPQDISTSYLACKALLQVRAWVDRFIPVLRGARIITIRSPWDGVTGTQVPLICKHPDMANLVIAGGGSYNHAKDAPGIGQRILDAAQGLADPDYGWYSSPSVAPGVQAHVMTDINFPDLERQAAEDTAIQHIYDQKPKVL